MFSARRNSASAAACRVSGPAREVPAGRRRDPGVGAAGAAVGGGGAVGGQLGDAPAGARVHGGGLQQAAGVVGVGQSPAAGVAGGGGPAVGGAGRDGEVDQRGERRGRPGRGTGAVVVVVVFAGAAAFVLPFGHVGAAVPAGVIVAVAVGASARRRQYRAVPPAGGLVLAGVRPGIVSGLGAGEAVAGVAALGQVVEGQHPQLLQGAGQPAAAQRDRERVDVRLGRQRVLDRQFPAGQERVAGFFPPGHHPLPVAPLLVLAALERLGVEFHRHRGGLAGQLVIPQPRRQAGQQLIGIGRVGVRQAPGGPPDQPGPVLIDQPGAERGPGAGQPGFQVGGQVHLVAGGVRRR